MKLPKQVTYVKRTYAVIASSNASGILHSQFSEHMQADTIFNDDSKQRSNLSTAALRACTPCQGGKRQCCTFKCTIVAGIELCFPEHCSTSSCMSTMLIFPNGQVIRQ